MFEIEAEYRRRDLHDRFGGNRQSGISYSKNSPIIFLFTSENKDRFGYHDGWTPEGDFLYSGEGQIGDMEMSRGNLAILEHEKNGKEIHLFAKSRKSMVRYIGQMKYHSHEIRESTPDLHLQTRTSIVFRLTPVYAGKM
jgi:5-methylcytosine-specific restriction protein A